ncbi:hypothetical protein [Umezawaea tangerina]|uniref:DUF2127 domain-containing protein n=1 Tax=Umezawaea tangerina TaxID=84725 RepID=A0A2T0T9V2_9PSEU|nr:hypothetical protein [Umezawaea tangerina]PRY42419.1 hypothetical protein CLV43_104252 [Umezawaea tangerina]
MDSLRKLTGRSAIPPEVLIAAVVAAGGALLFLLVGVLRWQLDGDSGWLRFPLVVAALELVVAAGLITGFRPSRITAVILFLLLALLHLLTTLNTGPVWARVIAGVLSAAHVYGVVLLNTNPALVYLKRKGTR